MCVPQPKPDRDVIAEAVLPGLLAAGIYGAEHVHTLAALHLSAGDRLTFNVPHYADQIAGLAYELADALLAQRKGQ